MSEQTLKTRLLGTIDFDTPETREHIKKRLKTASAGILPPILLEMMKQYGWQILGRDGSDEEKEKAKLLIAYAWWIRELDAGTPKNKFEEFMRERLEDLDKQNPPKYKIQAE